MLDVTNKKHLANIDLVQQLFYGLFQESRTDDGRGVVQFSPPPPLGYEHVKNGRLFVNRHAMLIELAKKSAIGAEVGVLRGDLSEFMLSSLNPDQLHLFDIDFETHNVADRFRTGINDGRVFLMKGDSSTRLLTFEDAYFDWIYVDGDHSYDGCKKDLEVSIKKTKADGLIFVNDYIMWSYTECRPYGVVHAVNEICVESGFQVIGFALHNGMYCDVALSRL